jgi:hypothetical protein
MNDPREFGIKGDGKTDDTAALQHALDKTVGRLALPRGDYLISKPLVVRLTARGYFSLSGEGGAARLIMTGPGPAIHVIGTHAKTSDPSTVADSVWKTERFPTVDGIEIVGAHAEADGVRVEGALMPTLSRVLVRRCRHGIHLPQRNRNVLLAHCHVYDCSGIGIFLDRINLHQINIVGCHVSFNKRGGIVISSGSEVRNIQITGNDIEYNYDPKVDSSNDILFDATEGSIREGTIASNTIQAKQSKGGAIIRFLGASKDNPNAIGSITITGNLIGSQETLVHLRHARAVVLSGNSLYNGFHHALLAEECEHLVLSGNSIDHNPDFRDRTTDTLHCVGCRHVNIHALSLQHLRDAQVEAPASLILERCRDVSLVGVQLIHVRHRGVAIAESELVRIADSTISGRGDAYRAAISADDKSRRLLVTNNFVARGKDGDIVMPNDVGTVSANVTT